MNPRRGCHAAWYELNISAPDDCVSACCYYAGPKEPWHDQPRSVDDYWNGAPMRRIREINADPGAVPAGGCADCLLMRNRGAATPYAELFEEPPGDMSPAQRENWLAAVDDYRHGRTVLSATPLRYYVNFGFACNLSCTMCHQVPRREANRRQASADLLLRWKEGFARAFDVSVIGGEPFALPEAIRFIRVLAADPDLDAVTLTILTNGTVHHKHLDTLLQKRKVRLVVSLDTLGAAFERIRIGASWAQIERNILHFLEAGRRHDRQWTVQSSCLLLKTVLPSLVPFCEWSVAHGVRPGFYDFIDARGIERTFAQENVLHHPELLAEVPGWESEFLRAAAVLRAAGWEAPAAQLDHYRAELSTALVRRAAERTRVQAVRAQAAWMAVYRWTVEEPGDGLQMNLYGDDATVDAVSLAAAGVLFRPTHLNDHLATPFRPLSADTGASRSVRLTCRWPAASGPVPGGRLVLQDERCNPLEPAGVSDDGRAGGVLERYYELPAAVRAIRLVMSAEAMEAVHLPTELVLEQATRSPARADLGRPTGGPPAAATMGDAG